MTTPGMMQASVFAFLRDSPCGPKVVNPVGQPSTTGRKRRRVRPPKQEAVQVVIAAFEKYPRLGQYVDRAGDREVELKSWSQSERGQTLFHNELMHCTRVSLQELSKKRAAFYDAPPPPRVPDQPSAAGLALQAEAEAAGVAADGGIALATPAALGRVPAPVTPPGGIFPSE